MMAPHSPNQNHLLGALPTEALERLAPHFELVPLLLGQMLYEPGNQQSSYQCTAPHRVHSVRRVECWLRAGKHLSTLSGLRISRSAG